MNNIVDQVILMKMKVLVAQSCLTFCDSWTVACQTPLSMGLPRQDTGVGYYSLLQGTFPTQGLNLGLLQCRQIFYHLNHQGSLILTSLHSQRERKILFSFPVTDNNDDLVMILQISSVSCPRDHL